MGKLSPFAKKEKADIAEMLSSSRIANEVGKRWRC
jgi:hypothetical protein